MSSILTGTFLGLIYLTCESSSGLKHNVENYVLTQLNQNGTMH